MFTIPVVEQCPYTVAGQGVMKFSHDVLGIIAGAVWEKDEWMALLIGTRSENGLEVMITDLQVPLQERNSTRCELVNPEPLTSEVIGVIHSHHNMFARFSTIDNDTLNPRFPTSIVVAQPRLQPTQEENLLGFAYQAEGRVPLPCGSIGIVKFTVLPDPLIEEWPIKVTAGFSEPHVATTLDNCPHHAVDREGLEYQFITQCGIDKKEPASAIFGQEGDTFLAEVKQKTRRTRYTPATRVYPAGYQGSVYPIGIADSYQGNSVERWDNDSDFLRHWGYVAED